MTRTRTALVAVAAALLSLSLVSSATAAPQSKLRITKVGFTPGAQLPDSSFILPGRVTNDGDKAARGKVRVRLDGQVIGKGRTVHKVKPGKGSDFSADVTVPADKAPGNYEIEACVSNHASSSSSCMGAADSMKVIAEDPGTDEPDVSDPPAACTSGSRTLGDRNFPEHGNGGYDAQHYDLFFDYDTAANNLETGTHVTMTADATQDLCDFALDFNMPASAIDSVTVNGVPATWEKWAPPGGAQPCPVTDPTDTCHGGGRNPGGVPYDFPNPNGCAPSVNNPPNPGVADGIEQHTQCPAMKLVVDPATDLADGSEFTVDVAYHGTPGIHFDPDGAVEGWAQTFTNVPAPGTPDGAYVVNEPIGAYEWMPVNDHPKDKATYDFRLTVPTGKTALGNGELLYYLDNGDGTTTWRWEMGYPMESAMSTTTSGTFDLTASVASNGIQYYNALDSTFTAAQKNAANVNINQHSAITNYLTARYGEYPFDSGGVVADNTAGSDINYVLEVQTKIHFPSSNVSNGTLVHETGHMWFGDSVSPVEWNHIWLNEGWATYSSYDYTAFNNAGTSLQSQFNTNYTAGTGTACAPPATGTNKWCIAPMDVDGQNTFNTFPTYTRHATMLIALRQIVGSTKFYNIAEHYQAQHKGSTMSHDEYFDLILDEAGRGASGFRGPECDTLEKFLHQWIDGTQIDPPYAFGNPAAPTITGTNFWSFVNGGGGASCTD
jgi:hypothetical protein